MTTFAYEKIEVLTSPGVSIGYQPRFELIPIDPLKRKTKMYEKCSDVCQI